MLAVSLYLMGYDGEKLYKAKKATCRRESKICAHTLLSYPGSERPGRRWKCPERNGKKCGDKGSYNIWPVTLGVLGVAKRRAALSLVRPPSFVCVNTDIADFHTDSVCVNTVQTISIISLSFVRCVGRKSENEQFQLGREKLRASRCSFNAVRQVRTCAVVILRAPKLKPRSPPLPRKIWSKCFCLAARTFRRWLIHQQ